MKPPSQARVLDSPRGAEDPDPGGGQVEKQDAKRLVPRSFDSRSARFAMKLKYFNLIVNRVEGEVTSVVLREASFGF